MEAGSGGSEPLARLRQMHVCLLTGGFDRPYARGMAGALASHNVALDVIGNADVDGPEMRERPGLAFRRLYPDARSGVSKWLRLWDVLAFYVRLLRYAAFSKPRVFHILWNHKLVYFDRTLLMLYYKLLGKRVVLTAHNVNAGIRDGANSFLNRVTLRAQYHLLDHILVHTAKMRDELIRDFGVTQDAVSVIPFGLNDSVPQTSMTCSEAKRTLGIDPSWRTILFFGNIRSYKGLEYLIEAMEILCAPGDVAYRLIIAGQEANRAAEQYWKELEQKIEAGTLRDKVVKRIEYIPDSETELYFKAADVSALPYTHIYQSGVLVLGYRFGLPAVASDVGSFAEDIVAGETGFVCRKCDGPDLARALKGYFESDLYRGLATQRPKIRRYAAERYSWDTVASIARAVYSRLGAEEF